MACSEVLFKNECVDIDENNLPKKIKKETRSSAKQSIKIDSPIIKAERCIRCKQYLDSVPLYNGHPNNSNEEFIALTEEKLSLFTGKEDFFSEQDEFPTHKVTYFSVYDDKGHLCPFDTGLIERNVELYFSGYIKPVYDEDPSTENGVPAHDMGPINEWWTAGYDGGEKLPIGFSTQYAEYYLLHPSPEYEPLFKRVQQKIKLAKLVIEFLLDRELQNPSYEDLIQHVESSGEYSEVEDTLIQHAQFLCDQVVNYDKGFTEGEKPLISLPCVRTLVNLAGVTFKKAKKIRKIESKGIKVKRPTWTKAVTTNLVRDIFESFFPDQLNDRQTKDENKGPKKKRCGICEACQSPDCGECNHCKDMLKFGGSGRSKQACKNRRCPNMAIMDAELSDNEEEADTTEVLREKHKSCSRRILHNRIKWNEKTQQKYKNHECYSSVVVDDLVIKPGDFVTLKSENPNEPLCVAKIIYMCDMIPQKFMFHGILFCRGSDTILGETSDPRELFLIDSCENLPIGSIVRKAKVDFREIPENWAQLGGEQHLPHQLEDDGENFHFTKRYDNAFSRFIDIENAELKDDVCISCKRKSEKKRYSTPVYKESGYIEWKNEEYKIGTGVFLKPDTFVFESDDNLQLSDLKGNKGNNVDEKLYPEFYRKKSDNTKGSNVDTPKPFIIGIIEKIEDNKSHIKISVRIFCRCEDTNNIFAAHVKDLNYLYWTAEVITTSFEKVLGKCYLAFGENLNSPREWSQAGPYRFYFTESYDPKTHTYDEVPMFGRKIGTMSKGKGGKGKGKSEKISLEIPPVWEKLDHPLRCLDVFSGCGGLSEGLHQAGIAESKWAIEIDLSAAQAFRLNNPDCKVFSDDCNKILSTVLNGEGKDKGLPDKGDVEMLVGGPPCQGFSGMNRFSAGQYSLFKNSLVVSYLSYCEYYRPKYFILENVKNFVSFKRSMVLKLTIRCLLAMGFQVAFGVLQAGHYGIPQTRRRLILLAAAPGYVLPQFPEPQHVFNKRGTQLSFVVDNFRYHTGCEWTESAPYRTICVRDALSDLPDINNGWSEPVIQYDGEAVSHFQKMMRGKEETDTVRDHICKKMAPLVEARMSHIPCYAGGDWRDLPNISVKLNDGTVTNILRYPYRTKKQKKSDVPKGVCKCAIGEGCDPSDKQTDTLIPWCLPHTGDRHNNWAGLYGRLEWDGYFGTTITNPEPMGKQGRVLHPEQNRVVSVRECARSQGFPDRFKFFGNILEKHKQVGNAVPPLLGLALGKEIRKAIVQTQNNFSL